MSGGESIRVRWIQCYYEVDEKGYFIRVEYNMLSNYFEVGILINLG